MIGGVDVVIPAVGDTADLEACVRIVQRYWPHARSEDAETGAEYARCSDIPFAYVHALFVYPDKQAEAAWEADSPDSPPNSMLYLILSPSYVTVVLDDPSAADMRLMLGSLRKLLWPLQRMDIPKASAA